ncbi:MAG: hypothetical protein ACI81R_000704 [Bradymonadia bacterium]|jgi:hypothetical protein
MTHLISETSAQRIEQNRAIAARCASGVLLVGLLSSALVFGCNRSGSDTSEREREEAEEASVAPRLVFSDDFETGELGEAWSTTSETWSVEDGWVAVAGARNAGLWLIEPLPEDVRIEFLARSLTDVGDLKFEIFTDGVTHESGYIGIFGGWNNQLNIVARLDEHGEDRLLGAEGQKVIPNQVYRFRIERTDNVMRWYIDDELFIAYDDEAPLTGEGHQHFGFNDWDAPVRFDEVRVYDLSPES